MDIMLPKTDQYRGNRLSVILFFFLFSSLFPAVLLTHAKDAPKNGSTSPINSNQDSKQTKDSTDQGKGIRFGVSVDLVMMYTSAFDSTGRFVSGLKQEQYKVFEDGVEQKISSFAQEDVPVTMGILLDLSGSMSKSTEKVNNAALAFIRASNPDDQVFLVGINDEAELIQDFTSDIDEIQDSLDNTVVAGQTILYDGIHLGVEKAHAGNRAKKAVVVITDGEDHTSFYKLDELVAKVQESDVQVFCVGFLRTTKDSDYKKAYNALIRISEESGGKAFFPQKIDEIHNIVNEIAADLRSQYSIGYFSANAAQDGSFRRVKISLSGQKPSDVHLRHKRGYFASKAEGSVTPKSGTTSREQ
jgi:Ca-activated chloride channel homolog